MNKGISFSDYCEANEKKELLSEWLTEKNGDLSVDRILSGSHKKVWWKCSYGHEWQAAIKARTEGCLCPVCQNRVVVSGTNDFATEYPLLAHEWHPNKNLPVTPAEIFAGSVKRYWWKCKKGHEWKAGVASRVHGNGCPVCAGKTVEYGFNDLQRFFPMSRANGILTKTNLLRPGT